VTDKLKSVWKISNVVYFTYYPGSFLKGLQKLSKRLSHDYRPRSTGLKPGTSEQEADLLATELQCPI